MTTEKVLSSGHPHAPAIEFFENNAHKKSPFVDEHECVGYNLCQLICPVDKCITMVEQPVTGTHVTWKEKMRLKYG